MLVLNFNDSVIILRYCGSCHCFVFSKFQIKIYISRRCPPKKLYTLEGRLLSAYFRPVVGGRFVYINSEPPNTFQAKPCDSCWHNNPAQLTASLWTKLTPQPPANSTEPSTQFPFYCLHVASLVSTREKKEIERKPSTDFEILLMTDG